MLVSKVQAYLSATKDRPFWITAFILLLPLLPLPFGSNRPWASDLYAVLSGLLLFMMAWVERDKPFFPDNAPVKRIMTSSVLVSLVIAWSFIQILPWAPLSWQHPIWQEASGVLGPLQGSISVDPGQFPESLVRLAAMIATFLLSYRACQNVQNAKLLVQTLTIAGLAYAGYGLIVESSGGQSILWYKKWAYEGFLTSTFVNKNSYAAYAGLSLLCCMTFLFQHFKDYVVKDEVLAHHSKLAAVMASLGLRDYLYLVFPVVLLAALAMTGSRAGIASTIMGCIAYLIALAANKKWRPHQWIALVIVAALLFLTFVGIGGEALLVRVDGRALSDDTMMRLAGYKLTIQALQDNPWLGFGLGTFDSAFRLYRDASLPLWFHHAHNDYLEMMMDLGVPVAGLLFTAIALVASCAITGIRKRRRDGVYPALAIGASVLVGTHALVDFSMHIPAIAVTYAALLGAGVAQSSSSRTQEQQQTTKPLRSPNTRPHKHPVKPVPKPTPVPPVAVVPTTPAVPPTTMAAPTAPQAAQPTTAPDPTALPIASASLEVTAKNQTPPNGTDIETPTPTKSKPRSHSRKKRR